MPASMNTDTRRTCTPPNTPVTHSHFQQPTVCCKLGSMTPLDLIDDSATRARLEARRRIDTERITRTATATATAVGYARVSSAEQKESGAGIDAQKHAVARWCEENNVELIGWILDEGVSGGEHPDRRPGLPKALAAVEQGLAEVIVVARLDRLSRDGKHQADLMNDAEVRGTHFIFTEDGTDTRNPKDRMNLKLRGMIADEERQKIRDNTRSALAGRRRKGTSLGRRSGISPEVSERIAAERAAGTGLQAIADGLNADEIPTAQGGTTWRPSSVSAVLTGRARAAVDQIVSTTGTTDAVTVEAVAQAANVAEKVAAKVVAKWRDAIK